MIDYRYLSTLSNPSSRGETLSEMFCAESYVHLSDAIMAAQSGNWAGQQVLVMMEREASTGMYNPQTQCNDPMMRRRFRIRVLCDEWGDPVKEGDKIVWKFDIKTRDKLGRKYTSRRKAELKRQGQADEFLKFHAALVDAEGCISLEFQDAGSLLNLHGIHYRTGLPISRAKELSGTVKPVPGGGFKHMRNWRYVEVPPDMKPADVAVNRGTAKETMVSVPGPAPVAAPPAPVAQDAPDATPAPAKPKRAYTRKAKPEPTGEPAN